MQALVVEDDARMAQHVASLLQVEGFTTQTCADGGLALKRAAETAFDLIVLDRMLPSLDGLEIVGQLRVLDVRTPVLFLSALGRVSDRVEGLEHGGDDYLVKPFADEELIARVRSLMRRGGDQPHPEVMLVGDIEIRIKARTVHRAGRHIATSPKEFELLRCLAEHAGSFLTRNYLLEKVWNLRFDPQTNVVDVHVSRLRRKMDEGFARACIVSARGEGYKLDPVAP
jgi:two-component system OmpR family response regulator